MLTLMQLVLGAAAALAVAQVLKLPVAPFAVASGFLLHALGAPLDAGIIADGLLLSAMFLVFTVGTEIDRRHTRTFRKAAILIGVLQCVITAAIAVPLALFLELESWTIVYLCLALAGGSTFLGAELLRERQHFFESSGRLTMGVALTQDFIVVILLAILVSTTAPAVDTPIALATLAALWAAAMVLMRWGAPYVMVRMSLDDEERLLFVMAVLFAFSGAAFLAGLPALTGSFFAGAALSRFPVSGLVRGHVSSFSDFFVVMFFTTIGTLLVLPSGVELAAEVMFVVALLILRPALLLPIVRRSGLTLRSALETVVLLSPVGELGLIVALIGVNQGHIGPTQLSTVAIVLVVTMSLVPWLSSARVTRALAARYPGQNTSIGEESGHILVIGCGESGTRLIESLEQFRDEVVVVDLDPVVVSHLNAQGTRAVHGDVTDPLVLRSAGISRARAIVSTVPGLEHNIRLLELPRAEDAIAIVRVFAEADAPAIRKLGGYPVVEADIAHDAFIDWFRDHPVT